jgi:hypothetical protein
MSLTFQRVFSDELLDHIATFTLNQANQKRKGPQGRKISFTSQDILQFIIVIIGMCGKREKNTTVFVRDKNRRGLGISKYEKIRAFLNFDIATLFGIFNKNLKNLIKVGGTSAIDEAIWPWKSDSEFVITIPRKPKDTGLRMYYWAFDLTGSGRPVLWHILPDLRVPCIPPTEVLDAMLRVWPENTNVSVTADAFFTSLTWLRAHSNLSITMGVPARELAKLVPLLTHNLEYHDYRIFTDGTLILNMWRDNTTVTTVTTAFKSTPPDNAGEIRIRGHDLTGQIPQLSVEATKILGTLPSADLRILAKMTGSVLGTGKLAFTFLFYVTSHFSPLYLIFFS